MTDLPERLWSHQETADFLSITPSALYTLNSRRKGPRNYKIGRECRYDPRDIEAWLGSRATQPIAWAAAA